jgi:murein DD-endopeptidase MepM/ murein hydrolase activator NlpD
LIRVDVRGRAWLAALAATATVAGGTTVALAANGSGGVGEYGGTEAGSRTGVFPVRGHHTYGDGLGAGRHHQGQDLMAKCGKAVVAAQPGRVEWVDYQASGAGNYVVIDGKRRLHDTVYMHLSKRPVVREGQRVAAGQLLGRVGTTGDSSACHLHFEMWSPKWSAGKPVDPEPYLRRWDKAS